MKQLENEELYDVIFTGKILDGFKETAIIRYMTKISGIDSFDIVNKLQTKKPFIVKSGLVIKDAETLVREFSRIGAVCSLLETIKKDKASLSKKVTDSLNSGIRSTKEFTDKLKSTVKRPKEKKDLDDVTFTGRFTDGVEKVIAIINMAEILNVDPADISMRDDELIITKSKLSHKDAEKLAPELLKIGVIYVKKDNVSMFDKVIDSLSSGLQSTKEFLGKGTDKVKGFAAESSRFTKEAFSSGINMAGEYVSGNAIIEKAIALGIHYLLLIAVIAKSPINEELKFNVLKYLLDNLMQKWYDL